MLQNPLILYLSQFQLFHLTYQLLKPELFSGPIPLSCPIPESDPLCAPSPESDSFGEELCEPVLCQQEIPEQAVFYPMTPVLHVGPFPASELCGHSSSRPLCGHCPFPRALCGHSLFPSPLHGHSISKAPLLEFLISKSPQWAPAVSLGESSVLSLVKPSVPPHCGFQAAPPLGESQAESPLCGFLLLGR